MMVPVPPDQTLLPSLPLEFLASVYQAAATAAHWPIPELATPWAAEEVRS